MKKLLFVSTFILYSCASNVSNNKLTENITFSENMSFTEFKIKLKVYSMDKNYPNIDD